MSAPAVTVAVPLYNATEGDEGETLRETLASAAAQEGADLEILVLDDGSRDDSLAVARAFPDPRIRTLPFAHAGIGASFNRCLENARGRYLKILPQDDLLAPGCIRELLALIEQSRHPALAFSRREILFDASDPWSIRWVEKHGEPDRHLQPLTAVNDGPELLRRWAGKGMLNRNLVGEPCAVLFPVALARQLGGFSPSMRQNLDFLLWLRLAARGDVCFHPDRLCSFRLHRSGTTLRNARADALQLEKYLLLHALGEDSEVTRILPRVPRWLRSERRKLCGLPVARFLRFWGDFLEEDELDRLTAAHPGRAFGETHP